MIQGTYILDTNVYGELLIEPNSEDIIKGINKDESTYIYGINIIEDELRDTPIEIKLGKKLFRDAVISIYEIIVDEELKLFPVAKYIASKYYEEYDRLRKSGRYYKLVDSKTKKYTEDDLKVDFQIIAMASLKGIDIVVSTDRRTILSNLAENTYNKVNKLNGLRTPRLVRYSDFKKRYLKIKTKFSVSRRDM
tara:strand:- start:920 stop:1498 length:579 start_codon:yes stop_codon:yes gene_type:complete